MRVTNALEPQLCSDLESTGEEGGRGTSAPMPLKDILIREGDRQPCGPGGGVSPTRRLASGAWPQVRFWRGEKREDKEQTKPEVLSEE